MQNSRTSSYTLPIELPARLAERVRVVGQRPLRRGGAFIVYWMHHAVRGHENPALDVAIGVANELGLPLVVYQGLGGRHRFNSDRHHAFILEGARDVAAELKGRGVPYVFHLPRDSRAASPLRGLAARAALVVTEEFPAPPFPVWTAALVKRTEAPVWCVDAACLLPMRALGERFDRAFKFTKAAQWEWDRRIGLPYEKVEYRGPAELPREIELGFEPFDVESSLTDAIAACDIDHTIPPVAHTRGGSRAGYARWEAFKTGGLRLYANRRNDAAADGVSRLSAYLHHGHVSPFRIAREAKAAGGAGAAKFLDELLTWRELAHNFCFHTDAARLETLAAIPAWARETLREHEGDEREALYSHETLARAATDDDLWNAAQRSLLVHGELHNNIRMTWGKAIVGWTPDAASALSTLIDLNHRYALDGNNPNSYGGLLWCLGQFDRPFTPEVPVLGSVRPRPTADHAARLDLPRYRRLVSRPASGDVKRVAVIGAGIAGLTAARTLADQGHEVVVFDKGRGPAGRMSTRRAEEFKFDHGAQFFTARDDAFARLVRSWEAVGVVERWSPRLGAWDGAVLVEKRDEKERWVGVGGMSAVCKHMARDLTVKCGVRVAGMRRGGERWGLVAESGEGVGEFDAVVVAVPAPQAAELVKGAGLDEVARAVAGVVIEPCWAVMLGFESAVEGRLAGFGGVKSSSGPVAWVAQRGERAMVLHASPAWSREHLELTAEEALPRLVAAAEEINGGGLPRAAYSAAHRWRYALVSEPLGRACVVEGTVVVCGDWCLGARVECGYLSGAAAAGRLLGMWAEGAPSESHEKRVEVGLFG